jgi:EAL and modified HD-GYP domain-containing signal transduction protein
VAQRNSEHRVRLGRQPILGQHEQLLGYELLFRDHSLSDASSAFDGNQATASVLKAAFMDVGLNRVVGSHWAFVNFPKEYLIGELPIPDGHNRLVIEVLEDVEVDRQLVDGLKKLARAGFYIALDDFQFSSQWEPCLEVADIVKLDVMSIELADLRSQVEHLRTFNVSLLAEKVEDYETLKRCQELGFEMFQGYYFAKPDILEAARSDSSRLALLTILAAINDEAASPQSIAESCSQDPRLVTKLLRYVNSSAIGMRHKLESLRHAIVYLGKDTVRSLATLLLMSSIDNKPPVLLETALVRASACQEVARVSDRQRNESYFTVGLLSMLDAMFDEPLIDIISDLPLTTEIKRAILNHEGPMGRALEAAIALEHPQASQQASQWVDGTYEEAYELAVASVANGDRFPGIVPVDQQHATLDQILKARRAG